MDFYSEFLFDRPQNTSLAFQPGKQLWLFLGRDIFTTDVTTLPFWERPLQNIQNVFWSAQKWRNRHHFSASQLTKPPTRDHEIKKWQGRVYEAQDQAQQVGQVASWMCKAPKLRLSSLASLCIKTFMMYRIYTIYYCMSKESLSKQNKMNWSINAKST